MFPLLKYSSSIITFYFYCVHLLQINFTVNPITPIEYIPWQWSDQFKISWEKRLFSKVTHTLGKLYYANKFTYVQQKSVPIESVGWQCPVDPSFYSGTRCGPDLEVIIYIYIYLYIYELGRREWPADFFFFQSNCDTYLWTKEKTKSSPKSFSPHQYQSPHSKKGPSQKASLLAHLQALWWVILPTCKVVFFLRYYCQPGKLLVLSSPSGHGDRPDKKTLQSGCKCHLKRGLIPPVSGALAHESKCLLSVYRSFLRFQTAYKHPDFKNRFFQRENSSSGAIRAIPVEGVIFFLSRIWAKKKREEFSKRA